MDEKSNLKLGIFLGRIEFQSYNREQSWAHENVGLLFIYSTSSGLERKLDTYIYM